MFWIIEILAENRTFVYIIRRTALLFCNNNNHLVAIMQGKPATQLRTGRFCWSKSFTSSIPCGHEIYSTPILN